MAARRLHSEEIYEAIVEDDAFAALPQRLAAAFGGRSTLIHCHYRDGSAQVLAHSGYFTEEQLKLYALNFAQLDPWAAATAKRQSSDRAANLEEFVPQRDYARSAFYNEYVRAMGDDTFHCMGLRIERPWGSAMLAIQRGRSQGSFGAAAVESLQGEIAHMRHMLALRGKFSALQRHAKTLETVLDMMPEATILTDCNGNIVHANAPAELLLREGDVIGVKNGGLCTWHHHSGKGVRDVIGRACDRFSPSVGSLLLARPDGGLLLVSATPLSAPVGGRCALLVLRDINRHNQSAPKSLERLFRLSPAEAEIACRLANGASVQEIAEERQVACGTVRSQVKSISSKLGCSRQAEIAGIVKTIALSSPAS